MIYWKSIVNKYIDIVVKPSHLLDHMNPKCEETTYNVLYCYILCTVL